MPNDMCGIFASTGAIFKAEPMITLSRPCWKR
jgi:hypothetical protein